MKCYEYLGKATLFTTEFSFIISSKIAEFLFDEFYVSPEVSKFFIGLILLFLKSDVYLFSSAKLEDLEA